MLIDVTQLDLEEPVRFSLPTSAVQRNLPMSNYDIDV